MYAIEYQRAKSVADATAALAKTGGKALAGGQSLVGAMKLRLANPGTVVDLSGIAELKGIKKEGDAVVIGALTTHAEVASSSTVSQAIPALAALAEGITAVSFPVPKKAAYVKFPQPASRFALVGVLVAQTAGGVRVAVTGAGSHVHRSKPIEEALAKSFTADAAKAVKVPADRLNNDLHGSAEYRAHLVSVLASRAVTAAG